MSHITLRPSSERGHSRLDWLDSRFSFSFADYHDPAHMGFRDLRVINEDVIAPGGGFPTHPHRDMEIITYVMDGALQHRDSLGTGAVIRSGEIQRMSAGTGILHSEFNASNSDPVHLLQIWILPAVRASQPSYAQQAYDPKTVTGKFGLIASQNGRDGSISLQQDVDLWLTKLKTGETASFDLRAGRGAWAQMARGAAQFGTTRLNTGDGAKWETASALQITALEDSEILLFDLN